jgi:hypothetical protein
VKNHDFTPKNLIFSNRKKIIFVPILGGCAPGAPPLDPPLMNARESENYLPISRSFSASK